MREHINTGVSFGLSSGVITTLGLIVGLEAGTNSALAVIGGIVTIAVADAMSDALGIHIAKESENVLSTKELWVATIATFITKFLMAISFVIPVLIFELQRAIIISVLWGLSVLLVLSYRLARAQNTNPLNVCFEHLTIAIIVIVLTHYLGDWVAATFTA